MNEGKKEGRKEFFLLLRNSLETYSKYVTMKATWPTCTFKSNYFTTCKFNASTYFTIHAVLGVDLRPLACWDCRFEFRRGHGCLSLVDVCYQAAVSATCWSLVQRSPTQCDVSECVV